MKKVYTCNLLTLLFMAVSFGVVAQEAIVSGVVRDKSDNQILPYVSVVVRNSAGEVDTRRSTATNMEGEFSIRVPMPSEVVFSYIGYDPVVRKITKEATGINVLMSTSENMLEETVIVGFQKRTRAATTAAVQVVETKDLVQTPVANAMELLQGRVPGLNIQMQTGTPGGTPSFTLRGISNINVTEQGDDFILGSSTPLFVVDGVPAEDINMSSDVDQAGLLSGATVSPLAMIPFEDIERIEILKDAAATSLYGSKGAYGVIIIETKKGNGPPKVSYSGNYVVRTPPRLRDVAVGNAERNLRMMQILQNDTSVYRGHNEIHNLPALADSLNPYWNNNTDWQGRFYGVTHNQTHNLSFSGGDSHFNYKINGNYYTEQGIVKNTDFNRYGLRTRLGYKPNNKFEMDINVSATFTINSQGSGNAFSQAGVAKGSQASSLLPPPSLFTATSDVLAAFSVKDNNQNTSYDASVHMKYLLPYEVGLDGTFGYKQATTERETFTPGVLNNNRSAWYNLSSNRFTLYGRAILSRTTRIKDLFKVGLDLGAEISSTRANSNTLSMTGSGSDYIWAPGVIHQDNNQGWITNDYSDTQNTLSFIINPTFSLGSLGGRSDRYVFIPNVRPEANSAYGTKVKWTVNPSLSFKWNFSREAFTDNWEWLNSGSARVSWGRTTKYAATRYDIWGTYLLGTSTYNGQPVIPIDFGLLPNDYLDPVTSTTWNIGTEWSMLNNRLRFTGDLYYRQTDNQLSNVSLADHNAFSVVKSIETSIVNYGIELLIGGRPLPSQSPWVLDLSLSLAINKDVMAKLPDEARQQYQTLGDGTVIVNRLGSNTMANYLFVNKGVYATDEDVPVNPATGERMKVQNNDKSGYIYLQAGDPIWADVNGDYIIDDKDRVVVGNSQPRMTGGFYVNLRYKNFSVNTNFSFVVKRDIINKALADRFAAYSNPLSRNLQETGALTPIDSYNFWQADNVNATYPNPFDYIRGGTDRNKVNFFRPDQTLFMEDGSYFKINGISMSYMFPRKVLDYLHIQRLQLNASVNNIYTFSKYSGINPENVNGLGYDTSGGYPNSRNWTVGVSIDF